MFDSISRIDWAELREQKLWLLAQAADRAQGLVHLLDAIQDDAVEAGLADEETVFGPADLG